MKSPIWWDQEKIGYPVPCLGCDYDLRGLRADGRCPECDQPVWPSLMDRWAAAGPEALWEQEAEWADHAANDPDGPEGLWNRALAAIRHAQCPPIAMIALGHVINGLPARDAPATHPSSPTDQRHLGLAGDDLCLALYEMFAQAGQGVGYDWCVNTRLDQPRRVARLVDALIQQGLLDAEPDDPIREFRSAIPASAWFRNRGRANSAQALRRWPLGALWLGLASLLWATQDRDLPKAYRSRARQHLRGLLRGLQDAP
ncbi:MAG: hypothetical protein AAGI68_02540 [Planctomycetota bacterium]